MKTISRNEINNSRWINTSIIRLDGKEEFRELKEYGDRHAVFDVNSQIGYVHNDEYNVTNFPLGTINHFSNYVEEKTGIPKTWVEVGLGILAIFAACKLSK